MLKCQKEEKSQRIKEEEAKTESKKPLIPICTPMQHNLPVLFLFCLFNAVILTV
jgi:hypothetical protein